jgi:ankyrin repeat protein
VFKQLLFENLLKPGSEISHELGDINAKDEKGETALHYAASQGHEEMVRLLLEMGADISGRNVDGWTALHHAAFWGHSKVVIVLLAVDEDVTGVNHEGWTALHCAVKSGHTDAVQELLKRGADPKAKTKNGSTALHIALRFPPNKSEMADMLLHVGVDINAQDANGWTPLHIAVRYSNGDSGPVKQLLKHDSLEKIGDNEGWTALHLAMLKGFREIAAILEEEDSVDTMNRVGWSPLHLAVLSHDIGRLKAALDAGEDIGVKDKDGRTPLHHAVRLRHKESIIALANADSARFQVRHENRRKSVMTAADVHCDLDMFAKLCQLYPSDESFHRNLADLLCNEKRYSETIATWEGILEREPRNNGLRLVDKLSHPHVICDDCLQFVYGYRFRCAICPDPFDLCQSCHEKPTIQSHASEPESRHLFLKIPSEIWVAARAKAQGDK